MKGKDTYFNKVICLIWSGGFFAITFHYVLVCGFYCF